MDRIRINKIILIKKLTDLHKSYFTVADLEKILDSKRDSLYVTLNRLVKSGVLIRRAKNVYTLFSDRFEVEKIGNELYFPSYLSFEYALSYYSILSQVPYTVTFATLRPTKKMTIGEIAVEFSHLKKELFFGYTLRGGTYIADKEKALLDTLYMAGLGKRAIDIEELDLKDIDRKKLGEYAKRFPAHIKSKLKEVKEYLGSTPITLEGNKRVFWHKKIGP